MPKISVFSSADRDYVRYLGDPEKPDRGDAWIARLVDKSNSSSMSAGVVVYERLTIDWDLPFDELITVVEGAMRIHSEGTMYELSAGDVAWFPAGTPLTYEVESRVVVSYATYPIPT